MRRKPEDPPRRAAILSALVLMALGVVWPPGGGTARADDAQVLPKGVSRASLEGQFYLPVDERYGADGHVEDVATDYNTTLDSTVFVGLLPAGAILGQSVVDVEYAFRIVELTYAYGVTNRLALGVKIPYWWVKNKVNASVVANAGNANVGVGTGGNIVSVLDPTFDHFITTAEVQALLGSVYGYQPVETWTGQGLSDIEVGGRYQYVNTDDLRLAFTGAVRLPTGEVDDPDNLMDYSFGQGAYALLFHLNNDYTGWERGLLNVTLIYEWVLPDKEVRRVPDDVNVPITANKEKVKRDLGDHYGVDVTGSVKVADPVTLFARYKFKASTQDDVKGSMGFAYDSLEQETAWREQVYHVGVTYSTLPRYMRTRSGVPWAATLQYRNRFDGKNNVLKSQYLSATVQVYF
jgi:hypothetical protein